MNGDEEFQTIEIQYKEYKQLIGIAKCARDLATIIKEYDETIEEYAMACGTQELIKEYDPTGDKLK